MVRRPPGMEMALLGFFQQRALHGYQLHQLVSDPSGLGQIWRLKQSQLYALLLKLEKDGYLWGELEPQVDARPPRRMFQLTAGGRSAFKQWLETPVNVPRLIRQEFMAKCYFAQKEGSERVRILLDLQYKTCQNWLDNLKAENVDRDSFYWSIHRYRLGQIAATLAWLDECRQEV